MKNIYILVDISLSAQTDKQKLLHVLNKYIDAHRYDYVSIYFFNHEIDSIIVNPSRIKEDDFDFRGRTALWDILNKVIDDASWDIFPEFIILSDCEDTASSMCTKESVKFRMECKKCIGWSFKIYNSL